MLRPKNITKFFRIISTSSTSVECQVPTCVGCTGKAEKASTGVKYDNFGGLDCM